MNYRNIITILVVMLLSSLFGCRQNPCSGDIFLRDFANASNYFLDGYTNSNVLVAKKSTLIFIEFLEDRKGCEEIQITVKSEMAVAYERLAQIYEELNLKNESTLYRKQSKRLEAFVNSHTGRYLNVTNIVSTSHQWLAPGWLTNKNH